MKRNALRTIWLATLALLSLSGAAAQNQAGGFAVTGTVIDQRRAPVGDATVTLHKNPKRHWKP
jgi:hypothetical protein